MKTYKDVMVPQRKEIRVQCNVCGKDIDDSVDASGVSVQVFSMFGFGSQKDGEVHEADICEVCYDTYRATWKIPATIEG